MVYAHNLLLIKVLDCYAICLISISLSFPSKKKLFYGHMIYVAKTLALV